MCGNQKRAEYGMNREPVEMDGAMGSSESVMSLKTFGRSDTAFWSSGAIRHHDHESDEFDLEKALRREK